MANEPVAGPESAGWKSPPTDLRGKSEEGLEELVRWSSGTGAAEEALLRATYGPLTDLIGVRGVGGEYWSDE